MAPLPNSGQSDLNRVPLNFLNKWLLPCQLLVTVDGDLVDSSAPGTAAVLLDSHCYLSFGTQGGEVGALPQQGPCFPFPN